MEKLNLRDARPINSPMKVGCYKLEDIGNLLTNNIQFRNVIGLLLYIARVTKVDIIVTVSITCTLFKRMHISIHTGRKV